MCMFAVLDGCCTGWLLHWMVAALDARLSNTTYNAPIIAKDLPVDHALLPVDLITSLNVTPSIVMHWPRVGVRVCGCAGVRRGGMWWEVGGGRWEVGIAALQLVVRTRCEVRQGACATTAPVVILHRLHCVPWNCVCASMGEIVGAGVPGGGRWPVE